MPNLATFAAALKKATNYYIFSLNSLQKRPCVTTK
jgi:hypothetical protein